MATHSSVLAWRIPWTGAWWATVDRVTKSRTRLQWRGTRMERPGGGEMLEVAECQAEGQQMQGPQVRSMPGAFSE